MFHLQSAFMLPACGIISHWLSDLHIVKLKSFSNALTRRDSVDLT
jgi:hypothetical protein